MQKLKGKIKKLFRTGFFHVFGGDVLNKIIAFMSSIVLVRLLTKSEYGNFSYAWNIYNIVILLNGLGIVSGTLQLCSENSGNIEMQERICQYGTKTGLRWNIILALTLLGLGLWAPLSISGAQYLLILLCMLPFLQFLFQQSTTLLRSQKRNREFARTNVINTVIIFVLSVAGSILFREKGLVLAYYCAYIISLVIISFLPNVKVWRRNISIPHNTSRDLIKISLISMCNNGLSQLLYLIDVFIIGIVMANEMAVASYKAATLIPSMLAFIPISVITYVYPYFAEHRNDLEWCRLHYKKLMFAMTAMNLFISAVLFAGAPLIISICFGTQYADAVLPFRILSVSYFFSGTFRVISGNLLVTQRKLKFNLLVAIISGVVNVILDYFLILSYGMIGAAVATLSVVILTSIMSTLYLNYLFSHGGKNDCNQ